NAITVVANPCTINNTTPYSGLGPAIQCIATEFLGYNATATATSTITNNATLTTTLLGAIEGSSDVSAFGPLSSSTATVSITNASTGVINSTSYGIYGVAYARANGYGTAAGVAIASVDINNAAAITSSNGDGITGYAKAHANAYGGAQ